MTMRDYKASLASSPAPAATGLVQRKCACGKEFGDGEQCPECAEKQGRLVQRSARGALSEIPETAIRRVLSSPGHLLDAKTAETMESHIAASRDSALPAVPGGTELRLGEPNGRLEQEADRVAQSVGVSPSPHDQPQTGETRSPAQHFHVDFSRVRVHTDAAAAAAADALHARAFTVGNHVAFASHEHAPETLSGRRLLAHELTHVAQQATGQPACSAVQCAPQEAERGEASRYRLVSMRFDGRDLIVMGDGQEVRRYSATSGRPVRVRPEHAEACGGNPVTDTYVNDPRYVGFEDHGAIPEGTYRFSPPRIQRFSTSEQFELLWGGITGEDRVQVSIGRIHAGDWGEGRVELTNPRIRSAPCGDAKSRSEFFLHGGVLAGSAGCIDIGGSFGDLADFLKGYTRRITVTVEYEHGAPDVRFLTGLGGAIAYGGFRAGHRLTPRLGVETGPAGTRPIVSAQYEGIVDWAGGALTLGVHLDVPLTTEDAFVRAGLEGGVNFRLLGALHARLFGGASLTLAGPDVAEGLQVGAGLQYDFGAVQLEALYKVLKPASEDERVQQALVGVGFRF